MSINKSTPFYLVLVKKSEALSYLQANRLVCYNFTYIGRRHETIVPGTKHFITQNNSSPEYQHFLVPVFQAHFLRVMRKRPR